MNKIIASGCLLAAAALGFSATSASGFLTYTKTGSDYNYEITLKNIGSTTIGTLWYAWIPGEGYLPSAPSAMSGPAGWALAQPRPGNQGFSLRWVAPAGGLLAAGSTLGGFKFTTTITPDELAGKSKFFKHPPVGTSFVYERGPFQGGSQQIVLNPVPEPATMTLSLAAGIAAWRRRSSRKK